MLLVLVRIAGCTAYPLLAHVSNSRSSALNAFLLLCRYASESLSFGVMDACLFQSFSRELKLRPNSWSNQLPAVVRYVRGKEHSRLPMPAAGDELGLRMNYFTQVWYCWSGWHSWQRLAGFVGLGSQHQ